jgi:hypothetical protein
MNEQCRGCPWLDEQKKECGRRSPKFCLLDRSDAAVSSIEPPRRGDKKNESRPKEAA